MKSDTVLTGLNSRQGCVPFWRLLRMLFPCLFQLPEAPAFFDSWPFHPSSKPTMTSGVLRSYHSDFAPLIISSLTLTLPLPSYKDTYDHILSHLNNSGKSPHLSGPTHKSLLHCDSPTPAAMQTMPLLMNFSQRNPFPASSVSWTN